MPSVNEAMSLADAMVQKQIRKKFIRQARIGNSRTTKSAISLLSFKKNTIYKSMENQPLLNTPF